MPSLKKLPRASETDPTTTTTITAANTDSAQSTLTKRKTENGEDKKKRTSEKKGEKERKGKKRKLEEKDDEEAEDEGTGSGLVAPEAAEKTRTKPQKTKKSRRVSFAPEVNEGIDADSGNEDDGDVDVADNDTAGNGQKTEADALSENPGVDATLDDANAKKKKKKKEKKKATVPTTTTAESITTPSTPSSDHEPPILFYLSQYHQNRSAWKFNKNRETHLFKHLWSLDHVPTKYNAALLAYLKGLKSEGARQRLSQTAEECIKADVEGKEMLSDPGADNKQAEGTENSANTDSNTAADMEPADKEAYEKAVHSFRSDLVADDMARQADLGKDDDDAATSLLDANLVKRLDRRRRADLVYYAVHGRTFDIFKQMPKNSAAIRTLKVAHQSQTDGANDKPAKKKRKNRTTVIEISSSESESDSDSDS